MSAFQEGDGVAAIVEGLGTLRSPLIPFPNPKLPVLCTQSSSQRQPGTVVATASNKITIASTGNNYVGFCGIPYANVTPRFEYSVPCSGKGQLIKATAYSQQCAQSGSGSQYCLHLNIRTPYPPNSGSTSDLRPVILEIPGRGFTGGIDGHPGNDGGNLASQEDIIVVTINYRLSTLGFMAIPGTNITGNYGITDQMNALEWTVKNIASFGGVPKKITIIGGSAGAGSVSPPAKCKFKTAIAMSSLGAGQNIFQATGCTQATLNAQIVCLKQAPALTLVGLGSVARHVAQDGTLVKTPQIDLKHGTTAKVQVIFGTTWMTVLHSQPIPRQLSLFFLLQGFKVGLEIFAQYAQSIINSGLFLCIDEATMYTVAKTDAFPASYYYTMELTGAGYDPNNLGGPPPTPGPPYPNPKFPYFRLHGSDIPWTIQLTASYFGSFVKTGQPNHKRSYLTVRGYVKALASIQKTGAWNSGEASTQGPIKLLDCPAVTSPFVDVPQGAFLNYSLILCR
ncbi:Alpha/Beta hydrolase protein [Calycina marina]|uniref:Carboxylic ester hydrolase n=1 Tax=Calycina marina TaxID=1763456 RepID=A0A9P8CDE2_9HELO|nr:Alpha/Beta hydrolase protein [Calycina marina]